MKFPVPAARVTHTGYAITTDRPSDVSIDSITIRRLDEPTARAFMSGLSLADRLTFRRLVKETGGEFGPAYLASTEDGLPILAARRLPGGPKTAADRRDHLGRSLPLVGEREHLLADLWVAKSATPAGLSAALAALAFIDPPANLARTVVMVAEPSRRRPTPNAPLLSALAGAGFTPYIHCLSQFTWKRPWRRRIDWIGPPPPARSVVSSAGTPGDTSGLIDLASSAGADDARGTERSASAFTQEVTP